jgi:hypothetical protein
MAETLAFAAAGKVKADIELQPLSSINKVFDRLDHGEWVGWWRLESCQDEVVCLVTAIRERATASWERAFISWMLEANFR